ncbi:hypothetical protein B0T19DRAFT_426802 [Cercophora scortea]|uniref:Uncharacterized protein n=1 Tax=Cercophora scortea TaxID=314031 RepID=A0AAE0IEI3_9PEZI|nr:hypothetical protein B0T19DRAFT_426802 [Cercophora scortea]
MADQNAREDLEIGNEPASEPAPELVPEPSLRALHPKSPDPSAVDAPVPHADVACEERVKDLDLKTVSHVVIQISDTRQEQVFRSVGYQFDTNRPSPFWYFLGKIAAQALYGDPATLLLLNYNRVHTREFIGFTTATWAATAKTQDTRPPVLVLEIDFKKPRPGEPLQLFWKPARGLITQRIGQWLDMGPIMDLSAPKPLPNRKEAL